MQRYNYRLVAAALKWRSGVGGERGQSAGLMFWLGLQIHCTGLSPFKNHSERGRFATVSKVELRDPKRRSVEAYTPFTSLPSFLTFLKKRCCFLNFIWESQSEKSLLESSPVQFAHLSASKINEIDVSLPVRHKLKQLNTQSFKGPRSVSFLAESWKDHFMFQRH